MTFYSNSTPPLFLTSQSPITRESVLWKSGKEKKKNKISPRPEHLKNVFSKSIFRSFTASFHKRKKNSGNCRVRRGRTTYCNPNYV
jgi:hypothetical protein